MNKENLNKVRSEINETLAILTIKEMKLVGFQIDGIDFVNPGVVAYFNQKNNQNLGKATLEKLLKNNLEYSVEIDCLKLFDKIPTIFIPYFIEYYKGSIINDRPQFNSKKKTGLLFLKHAIKVIKKHLPKFYEQFKFANQYVYLHDNPKILNFTSIETLGMLYFYVIEDSSVVYFLEELIHQGSHNYFYYVLYHKEDYFKIDSINTLMKDVTQKEWDYRSVYGAFHGLFTVAQRLENFDILLEKGVFKEQEKHELLGRLTDQFSRFHTGLELLDQDEIFTMKGQCLYKELDDLCVKYINKYKKLKTIFDLSHRDLDFRYSEFCKANPYEDFLRMEEQGLFKFN